MYNVRPIETVQLFNASAILQAGVLTSAIQNLKERVWNAKFSLQYIFTGAGHITITYSVCSTVDGTFLTPSVATAILTAGVAGSDILYFSGGSIS